MLGHHGWNGMVGLVLDKKVDMVGAAMTWSLQRTHYLKFLPPIGLEKYSLLIAASTSKAFSWTLYLNPFKRESWLVLIALCILIALFVQLLETLINEKLKSLANRREVVHFLIIHSVQIITYYNFSAI